MTIDQSEFELEKIQLSKEHVSPEQLVSEVIRLVRPLAYQKAIELKLHLHSEIPGFVLTDPVRLRQIILNLLNNSIKYTESGKVKLQVSYEKMDAVSGDLQFSVSDTGPGLPMGEMPRLMRAFQRNSSSTPGTGLGLYIAARLIDIFGGRIHADSTQICDDESSHDHGTCFSFRIPVQVSCSDTLIPRVDDTVIDKDKLTVHVPESVLIADDDRIARKVHRKMIEHMYPSCRIFEASDGIDAVSLWHQHHTDIIFMDISMKIMDGMEAARTIRRLESSSIELESRKKCVLIALTGRDSTEISYKCRESGFDHVFNKPVKLADISGYLSSYAR
ncbi:hybrid sensor histidine kinase/response regulator [Spirochaeta dissipatitropha]